MDWRTLEHEIISILRSNGFEILHSNSSGDSMLYVDYDYDMTFNLTTFAKDLAKRLESK